MIASIVDNDILFAGSVSGEGAINAISGRPKHGDRHGNVDLPISAPVSANGNVLVNNDNGRLGNERDAIITLSHLAPPESSPIADNRRRGETLPNCERLSGLIAIKLTGRSATFRGLFA